MIYESRFFLMHMLNLSISNCEGSLNALGNFFQLLITAILYVIPSLKVSKFSVLSQDSSARCRNLFKIPTSKF